MRRRAALLRAAKPRGRKHRANAALSGSSSDKRRAATSSTDRWRAASKARRARAARQRRTALLPALLSGGPATPRSASMPKSAISFLPRVSSPANPRSPASLRRALQLFSQGSSGRALTATSESSSVGEARGRTRLTRKPSKPVHVMLKRGRRAAMPDVADMEAARQRVVADSFDSAAAGSESDAANPEEAQPPEVETRAATPVPSRPVTAVTSLPEFTAFSRRVEAASVSARWRRSRIAETLRPARPPAPPANIARNSPRRPVGAASAAFPRPGLAASSRSPRARLLSDSSKLEEAMAEAHERKRDGRDDDSASLDGVGQQKQDPVAVPVAESTRDWGLLGYRPMGDLSPRSKGRQMEVGDAHPSGSASGAAGPRSTPRLPHTRSLARLHGSDSTTMRVEDAVVVRAGARRSLGLQSSAPTLTAVLSRTSLNSNAHQPQSGAAPEIVSAARELFSGMLSNHTLPRLPAHVSGPIRARYEKLRARQAEEGLPNSEGSHHDLAKASSDRKAKQVADRTLDTTLEAIVAVDALPDDIGNLPTDGGAAGRPGPSKRACITGTWDLSKFAMRTNKDDPRTAVIPPTLRGALFGAVGAAPDVVLEEVHVRLSARELQHQTERAALNLLGAHRLPRGRAAQAAGVRVTDASASTSSPAGIRGFHSGMSAVEVRLRQQLTLIDMAGRAAPHSSRTA